MVPVQVETDAHPPAISDDPRRRLPLGSHTSSLPFSETEARLLGGFGVAQMRINWRAEHLSPEELVGELARTKDSNTTPPRVIE